MVNAESPRAKVIGVGLPKTGTSTFGDALVGMGYQHCGQRPKLLRQAARGDLAECLEAIERYDSFEDNPWWMLYENIDQRYPDAKFVLTVRRDPNTWYQSVVAQVSRIGPTPEGHAIFGSAWPRFHRDAFIEFYERHNSEVRNYFAGRREKLLEVCWETGSSVDELADFLELQAGARETPWVNARSRQRVELRHWGRNLARYVVISGFRFDPRLYTNADYYWIDAVADEARRRDHA